MIVYRVLETPSLYEKQSDGSKVWGINCLIGEDDIIGEDLILFDEEDMAWKFYHDVNRQFEPMVIDNEG